MENEHIRCHGYRSPTNLLVAVDFNLYISIIEVRGVLAEIVVSCPDYEVKFENDFFKSCPDKPGLHVWEGKIKVADIYELKSLPNDDDHLVEHLYEDGSWCVVPVGKGRWRKPMKEDEWKCLKGEH